jgi:uncharacterized membrane protein YhhN
MMFTWPFYVAILFALVDWYAALTENRKLLLIAKPAVVIFMMLWSYMVSGWQGGMLWFGLGLVFSLGGDVALLFSARWFLLGLSSFLVAHIMFIIGFNVPIPEFSPISAAIAIIVGVTGARLLRAIRAGVARMPGAKTMMPATLVYGTALCLMLLSAFLTFFNSAWSDSASLCAASGAALFFTSDSMLSYDRFVKKLDHARFWVHLTYHLGLFGIITGALIHFVK